MRGGLELIRRSMFGWMVSRGFFWALTFIWTLPSILYLFLWSTVSSEKEVKGYDQDAFVAYYLIFMIVSRVTYTVSNWTVGDVIRSGGFSTWLLRPLAPIFEAISGEVAYRIVSLPFTFIVVGVLWVIFMPSVQIGIDDVVRFALALTLAVVLRFISAYALSLVALWTSRADALFTINNSLIFLFAGEIVPVSLLPDVLRNISDILPFKYMIGFPVEVMLGRVTGEAFTVGIAIQFVWTLVFGGLCFVVWKNGLKHYSAVGG